MSSASCRICQRCQSQGQMGMLEEYCTNSIEFHPRTFPHCGSNYRVVEVPGCECLMRHEAVISTLKAKLPSSESDIEEDRKSLETRLAQRLAKLQANGANELLEPKTNYAQILSERNLNTILKLTELNADHEAEVSTLKAKVTSLENTELNADHEVEVSTLKAKVTSLENAIEEDRKSHEMKLAELQAKGANELLEQKMEYERLLDDYRDDY